MASQDLWNLSKENLMQYIDKSSHRQRLRKMMLDDVIEYCLTMDVNKVVPILCENKLILS
jgi:phosphosulfolactate phosphohydrolase-like enzyme